MLNFAGQTSRAAAGRLHHHVISCGAAAPVPLGLGLVAPAGARVNTVNSPAKHRFPLVQDVRSQHLLSHLESSSSVNHSFKSLPVTRTPASGSGSPLICHACRVPCQPLDKCSSQSCLRYFGTSSPTLALTKSSTILPEEKPGLVTRVLDSVGITGKLRFNRFKMRVAGLNMYKACADGYDFETFFRACNMPDTLFSWFLVMELHVWMCMVRLKQEGREGKYLTHYLILSMWHDVQQRGKLMGIPSVKMKESLTKMVEQFNGALFAYDEGLMSNDKVLAAALWRNLFLRNCDDPERLANMVEYVRQQAQYLDSLDSVKLLQVGRIKWLPYAGTVPDSTQPLPKAASLDEELHIPEVDKVPV